MASAGFIPIFTRYWHNPLQKKRAWEFANNALNAIALAMAAACAVLFVFSLVVTLAGFAVAYWGLGVPWGVALVPGAAVGVIAATASARQLEKEARS